MGAKIRELRRRQFLTQRQLAERMGCTIQAISFWEQGHRKPSLASLEKMAQIFPREEVEALAAGA